MENKSSKLSFDLIKWSKLNCDLSCQFWQGTIVKFWISKFGNWHFCQIWLIIPYLFDLNFRFWSISSIFEATLTMFFTSFYSHMYNTIMVMQNGQVNMKIKFVMIAIFLTKLKLFYLSLEYWKMSKYSLSALVFKNVF